MCAVGMLLEATVYRCVALKDLLEGLLKWGVLRCPVSANGLSQRCIIGAIASTKRGLTYAQNERNLDTQQLIAVVKDRYI